MFPLYRHYKGKHYLRIATVTHSETLEPHVFYRSLYDNPVSGSWVRPEAMFLENMPDGTPRFDPIGGIRIATPEDERELLLFGHDTWGRELSAEAFVTQAMRERNHMRGIRYLLEAPNGERMSKLSVIRFFRGCAGFCSIATRPDKRGLGYGTVLVRAVMELLRLEEPEMRFLLFSEVDPVVYERQGFRALPESEQRFRPSVAMVTGKAPLTEREAACLKEYF
jgi:GNAT superfamily N-acetyltransferase